MEWGEGIERERGGGGGEERARQIGTKFIACNRPEQLCI